MKLVPQTKFHASGMAFAALLLTSLAPAHAQVVANFTDGNGNTLVDQYTGIAGDGWADAWGTNTAASSSGTTFIPNVINTDPLNGGGNYLSTTLTAGTGTSKGLVQRRIDGGTFNLTSIYTVSFDIRLDTDFSTFTSTTDYLQIMDRFPYTSDFGSDGSWLIRATGASVNGIAAQTWMFYNGGKDGAGFNTANFVDSGVALFPGTVYTFVVTVDPANLEWTVSINGGATSSPLGFRTGSAANIGSINFGGQTSDTGEVMTFSVDNIVAVPEASTSVLAILGGIGGLAILRRRRNQV